MHENIMTCVSRSVGRLVGRPSVVVRVVIGRSVGVADMIQDMVQRNEWINGWAVTDSGTRKKTMIGHKRGSVPKGWLQQVT